MNLGDLPKPVLQSRLREQGIQVPCGPLLMRLATSLPELAEAIALLYADFPVEDDGAICDFEARVDPAWPWLGAAPFRARAFIDGRRAFGPFPRRQALPMFEWAVNWSVFTRPNQYLLLHAAVLERGGAAVILSGKPGAGKSTLASGLLFRGWRFLSDEVAMIRTDGRLLPLPRPLSLKDESIDLVRGLAPQAVIGPACEGTRKGTVAHLRPPAESVRRAREATRARWLVFPRYTAGASTDLRPVSRAQALLRAGDEAFNYSMLGCAGFETLADVVNECSCFDLRFDNLGEALDALEALAPSVSPPAPASGRADEVPSHGT